MFEKNIEKETVNLEDKVGNISLKDNYNNKLKEGIKTDDEVKNNKFEIHNNVNSSEFNLKDKIKYQINADTEVISKPPSPIYKSSKEKFDFLQTQLSDDALDTGIVINSLKNDSVQIKNEDALKTTFPPEECSEVTENIESNITDDSRLAQSNILLNPNETKINNIEPLNTEEEITISVPPRRKKQILADRRLKALNNKTEENTKEYPDHLNPFSDEENEVCIKI